LSHFRIPPNLHSQTAPGPLCPFYDHSIGSRDGRIARYTDSQACVHCVSALTEGRLSLDVHQIHQQYRARFLEFWSFVDIQEPTDCWNWQGTRHPKTDTSYYSMRRHWGPGHQYSAARVAVWFTWGDIGRLEVKHACGNRHCCNPLHIRVVGVPHFFRGRGFQQIDLEYSTVKLRAHTHDFINSLARQKPRRYERLREINAPWMDDLLTSPDLVTGADEEPAENGS
jgi:hypothetical protein